MLLLVLVATGAAKRLDLSSPPWYELVTEGGHTNVPTTLKTEK